MFRNNFRIFEFEVKWLDRIHLFPVPWLISYMVFMRTGLNSLPELIKQPRDEDLRAASTFTEKKDTIVQDLSELGWDSAWEIKDTEKPADDGEDFLDAFDVDANGKDDAENDKGDEDPALREDKPNEKQPEDVDDGQEKPETDDLEEIESGLNTKKRGRPPGRKDARKRKRRTKKEMEQARKQSSEYNRKVKAAALWGNAEENSESEIDWQALYVDDNIDDFDSACDGFYYPHEVFHDKEPGEELVQIRCFLTTREVLFGENRRAWYAARDKEKLAHKTNGTWVWIDNGEYLRLKRAGAMTLPCASVWTVKRDGTHKCRLVCLGNRIDSSRLAQGDLNLNLFSGTVSYAALRSMVVEGLSEFTSPEL